MVKEQILMMVAAALAVIITGDYAGRFTAWFNDPKRKVPSASKILYNTGKNAAVISRRNLEHDIAEQNELIRMASERGERSCRGWFNDPKCELARCYMESGYSVAPVRGHADLYELHW